MTRISTVVLFTCIYGFSKTDSHPIGELQEALVAQLSESFTKVHMLVEKTVS